jgi:hypothetical protein
MRSLGTLILALLALTAVLGGCGAAERGVGEASGQPTTTVRGYGLKLEVPLGWHGDVVRPEPPGALTLRAANFQLPPASDVGQQAQGTMAERDVLITLTYYGRAGATSAGRRAILPLVIDRRDFMPFEGFARPVATDSFALGGGAFQHWVVFRDEAPSDELVAEANRVLATVALEPRRLALDGLSIVLPLGWDGYVKHLGPDRENPALYAANVPWPDVGQNLADAPVDELFERLPRDGVVISAASGRNVEPGARALTPPIKLADGYFLADSYEGQPAPHVSTQLIFGRVGDRFLNVQVFFGCNDPDGAMRGEADAVLATLAATTP